MARITGSHRFSARACPTWQLATREVDRAAAAHVPFDMCDGHLAACLESVLRSCTSHRYAEALLCSARWDAGRVARRTVGLHHRALIALIALMVFSFARVGAVFAMRVDDVYLQQRRLWVPLREKDGNRHGMPCHHTLDAYLDGTDVGDDPIGPLFRTMRRGTRRLSATPLPQANAYAMIRPRAIVTGIGTQIGSHTFRATGITAYLKNGGTLENAAAMANHASTRAAHLYDQRRYAISLEDVARIPVNLSMCRNHLLIGT